MTNTCKVRFNFILHLKDRALSSKACQPYGETDRRTDSHTARQTYSKTDTRACTLSCTPFIKKPCTTFYLNQKLISYDQAGCPLSAPWAYCCLVSPLSQRTLLPISPTGDHACHCPSAEQPSPAAAAPPAHALLLNAHVLLRLKLTRLTTALSHTWYMIANSRHTSVFTHHLP